jgi:hypothetical protein
VRATRESEFRGVRKGRYPLEPVKSIATTKLISHPPRMNSRKDGCWIISKLKVLGKEYSRWEEGGRRVSRGGRQVRRLHK